MMLRIFSICAGESLVLRYVFCLLRVLCAAFVFSCVACYCLCFALSSSSLKECRNSSNLCRALLCFVLWRGVEALLPELYNYVVSLMRPRYASALRVCVGLCS